MNLNLKTLDRILINGDTNYIVGLIVVLVSTGILHGRLHINFFKKNIVLRVLFFLVILYISFKNIILATILSFLYVVLHMNTSINEPFANADDDDNEPSGNNKVDKYNEEDDMTDEQKNHSSGHNENEDDDDDEDEDNDENNNDNDNDDENNNDDDDDDDIEITGVDEDEDNNNDNDDDDDNNNNNEDESQSNNQNDGSCMDVCKQKFGDTNESNCEEICNASNENQKNNFTDYKKNNKKNKNKNKLRNNLKKLQDMMDDDVEL